MQDTLIKHLPTDVLSPWTSPMHLLVARIKHLSPSFAINFFRTLETFQPTIHLYIVYTYLYASPTPPPKKKPRTKDISSKNRPNLKVILDISPSFSFRFLHLKGGNAVKKRGARCSSRRNARKVAAEGTCRPSESSISSRSPAWMSQEVRING